MKVYGDYMLNYFENVKFDHNNKTHFMINYYETFINWYEILDQYGVITDTVKTVIHDKNDYEYTISFSLKHNDSFTISIHYVSACGQYRLSISDFYGSKFVNDFLLCINQFNEYEKIIDFALSLIDKYDC